MAWMQKCYETYENNVALAGRAEDENPLSLVAHILQSAQVEITINQQGQFITAREVEKEHGRTLIPVTEKSASRTSGVAPHALCDNLSYVARDYTRYLSDEKQIKVAKEKHDAYMKALQAWVESDYSHPKVKAIYTYIQNNSMVHDLIEMGIVECEDGKFSNKKIAGTTYDKVLVRFIVYEEGSREPDAVWQDKTVLHAYTEYYLHNLPGKQDICYLLGEPKTSATVHPKGIIPANNGAKIISANDNTDFTFRGRFNNSEEAYAVSYEASQKAHNALRWLAANQGVNIGTKDKRTFICWNPKGKKIMNMFQNPFNLQDDEEEMAHTAPEYKRKLYKAFMGWKGQLEDSDDIVIMSLDAATTGRLSITYYNELMASDFYQRMEYWYDTFHWYFPKYKKGEKPSVEIKTPLTTRIVEYAFGVERETDSSDTGNNYKSLLVNDKVLKEETERLIECMIDRRPIPRNIVHALVNRASTPQAYSRSVHEQILSTACAAIKKEKKDYEGKDESMELDKNNRNRSYLFGRLLAIAERVERSTYQEGESREPNAMRLQTAFVNHPMHTWVILENALKPYFERLSVKSRIFYKNLIGEIFGQFREEDKEILNKALGEEYLLGYYLQRAELYGPKKENSDSNNNREE